MCSSYVSPTGDEDLADIDEGFCVNGVEHPPAKFPTQDKEEKS